MEDIKEGEIFKPYSKRYWISNLGRVWDSKRSVYSSTYKSNGYWVTYINDSPPRIKQFGSTYPVHRMIATAFIPNPNNYPVVNHIDGVKSNNAIENLEWCTQQYNVNHALRIGLLPYAWALPFRITCKTCNKFTDSRVLRSDPKKYQCAACKRVIKEKNNKKQLNIQKHENRKES